MKSYIRTSICAAKHTHTHTRLDLIETNQIWLDAAHGSQKMCEYVRSAKNGYSVGVPNALLHSIRFALCGDDGADDAMDLLIRLDTNHQAYMYVVCAHIPDGWDSFYLSELQRNQYICIYMYKYIHVI